MSPKPPTTLKVPVAARPSPPPARAKLDGPSPADFAAKWIEARLAYPLYAALTTQFNLAPLPHPTGELPPARPTREVFDRDLHWMDEIDAKVKAFQVRQLPSETLNASEEAMRAFVLRQLKKADKTNADRDKIDLLLVQYFALCAPEDLYRQEIALADVAAVLKPVLAEADPTPLEWCEPLETILGKLDGFHSLRDLLEEGIFEQSRLLKDSAGCMFYDPAALVAFCRFNFLVRRAFIRMLHADLTAIKQALDDLDATGLKTVDCRRAGFSAAESIAQMRHFFENWRQPFQKDYTENSVSRSFEQLLGVRADLEEAVARAHGRLAAPPAPQPKPAPAKAAPKLSAEKPARVAEAAKPAIVPARPAKAAAPAIPAKSTKPPAQAAQPPAATSAPPAPPAPVAAGAKRPQAANVTAHPAPAAPSKPAAPAPAAPARDVPPSPAPDLDPDKCLETIWEQLIAAPPSRGRSMSTVVLEDTKVLLSSWEVAAFVTEGGQEAEDLRRAVVGRALLAIAMDRRKRSGDQHALQAALELARGEVSYFQGRVEQAKRAKNTEAAVNLGISTKRMLSFIEEAEKLQP